MRRVAVTGIGLVSALGVGTEETWNGLVEGRSGIGPIESYDASSLQTRLAAEVSDFEPEQFANRKTLRSMTRNDQLALAGATLAIQDSGFEFGEDGSRNALFVGSNKEISNPMHILEGSLVARNDDGTVDLKRLGANASSAFYPLFYVEGLQAASLFYVSQTFGLMGANTYFAGTAEAGAAAIGRGFRSVRRGEVERGDRRRVRRRGLVVVDDEDGAVRGAEPEERARAPVVRSTSIARARSSVRALPSSSSRSSRQPGAAARGSTARSPASAAPAIRTG